MAKQGRHKDGRHKRTPGPFSAIPDSVLKSEAWANTSAWGTRLIMDLAAQYKGNNNGDLCAAWKIMKERGWKSEDTLNRAKKELLDKKWIIITRKGGRNVPHLYALTFYGIDECNGKLDPHIIPRDTPRDSWRVGNKPPDIAKEKAKERTRKIKSATTATVVTMQ